MIEGDDCIDRKTLDNNNLIQVVASSGFSENKGLLGVRLTEVSIKEESTQLYIT